MFYPKVPPTLLKECLTFIAQVADPSIVFVIGKERRETTELIASLNTWKEDRWFVVFRVLKDGKKRNSCHLQKAKCMTISFLPPI